MGTTLNRIIFDCHISNVLRGKHRITSKIVINVINVYLNFFYPSGKYYFGLLSVFVFSRRKPNFVHEILGGCLKMIETIENSLKGMTERWPRPLNRDDREIGVLLQNFINNYSAA